MALHILSYSTKYKSRWFDTATKFLAFIRILHAIILYKVPSNDHVLQTNLFSLHCIASRCLIAYPFSSSSMSSCRTPHLKMRSHLFVKQQKRCQRSGRLAVDLDLRAYHFLYYRVRVKPIFVHRYNDNQIYTYIYIIIIINNRHCKK